MISPEYDDWYQINDTHRFGAVICSLLQQQITLEHVDVPDKVPLDYLASIQARHIHNSVVHGDREQSHNISSMDEYTKSNASPFNQVFRKHPKYKEIAEYRFVFFLVDGFNNLVKLKGDGISIDLGLDIGL